MKLKIKEATAQKLTEHTQVINKTKKRDARYECMHQKAKPRRSFTMERAPAVFNHKNGEMQERSSSGRQRKLPVLGIVLPAEAPKFN